MKERKFRITEEHKKHLKLLDLNLIMEELFNMHCKHRSGGVSYYNSPFRKDEEPSFGVSCYKGEWRWKDWGGDPDGDWGDIFALVMRAYKVDFLEAGRMLLRKEFPAEYYKTEAVEEIDKEKKISYAKWLYTRNLKVNNISKIAAYFKDLGVAYHDAMGCTTVTSFKDKITYLATPIPTPWEMRGLEMRGMKDKARKTYGEGTIWTLNRDPRRVLVTESVLDSLAGEIILGDSKISLWALNSTANVNKLAIFLSRYKPDEVFLALDNDAPGITAKDKAVEIISQTKTGIIFVEDHFKAGVKDLHKLIVRADTVIESGVPG